MLLRSRNLCDSPANVRLSSADGVNCSTERWLSSADGANCSTER